MNSKSEGSASSLTLSCWCETCTRFQSEISLYGTLPQCRAIVAALSDKEQHHHLLSTIIPSFVWHSRDSLALQVMAHNIRRPEIQSLESLISRQRDRLDSLAALGAEVSGSVQRSAEESSAQLQRAQHCLDRIMEWALLEEQDQEAWARVKAATDKVKSSPESRRLDQELKLLGEGRLRVSLRMEMPENGGEWQGDDILVQDFPPLRLALLLLLRKNMLRSTSPPPLPPPPPPPTPPPPFLNHTTADPESEFAADHEILDLTYASLPEEKQAILQSDKPVRFMMNVWCSSDPSWALAMLRKHAPVLEELRVFDSDREHLHALQYMSNLRRLEAWNWSPSLASNPYEFKELPGPGDGVLPHRVRWLEVWLPSRSVESLIYINRHTLKELRLSAPAPNSRSALELDDWPERCWELPQMLARCDLRCLLSLTLLRYVYPCDGNPECSAQLASVRSVLPDSCYVECEECSSSPRGSNYNPTTRTTAGLLRNHKMEETNF